MPNVIEKANKIVEEAILLRVEMTKRQVNYAQEHPSPCNCPTCQVHLPKLVVEEYREWKSMLAGCPTAKDKKHPEWERNKK
ncbi:MAG: hypothetical protein WAV41_00870 [Microgenomates group bacterium]